METLSAPRTIVKLISRALTAKEFARFRAIIPTTISDNIADPETNLSLRQKAANDVTSFPEDVMTCKRPKSPEIGYASPEDFAAPVIIPSDPAAEGPKNVPSLVSRKISKIVPTPSVRRDLDIGISFQNQVNRIPQATPFAPYHVGLTSPNIGTSNTPLPTPQIPTTQPSLSFGSLSHSGGDVGDHAPVHVYPNVMSDNDASRLSSEELAKAVVSKPTATMDKFVVSFPVSLNYKGNNPKPLLGYTTVPETKLAWVQDARRHRVHSRGTSVISYQGSDGMVCRSHNQSSTKPSLMDLDSRNVDYDNRHSFAYNRATNSRRHLHQDIHGELPSYRGPSVGRGIANRCSLIGTAVQDCVSHLPIDRKIQDRSDKFMRNGCVGYSDKHFNYRRSIDINSVRRQDSAKVVHDYKNSKMKASRLIYTQDSYKTPKIKINSVDEGIKPVNCDDIGEKLTENNVVDYMAIKVTNKNADNTVPTQSNDKHSINDIEITQPIETSGRVGNEDTKTESVLTAVSLAPGDDPDVHADIALEVIKLKSRLSLADPGEQHVGIGTPNDDIISRTSVEFVNKTSNNIEKRQIIDLEKKEMHNEAIQNTHIALANDVQAVASNSEDCAESAFQVDNIVDGEQEVVMADLTDSTMTIESEQGEAVKENEGLSRAKIITDENESGPSVTGAWTGNVENQPKKSVEKLLEDNTKIMQIRSLLEDNEIEKIKNKLQSEIQSDDTTGTENKNVDKSEELVESDGALPAKKQSKIKKTKGKVLKITKKSSTKVMKNVVKKPTPIIHQIITRSKGRAIIPFTPANEFTPASERPSSFKKRRDKLQKLQEDISDMFRSKDISSITSCGIQKFTNVEETPSSESPQAKSGKQKNVPTKKEKARWKVDLLAEMQRTMPHVYIEKANIVSPLVEMNQYELLIPVREVKVLLTESMNESKVGEVTKPLTTSTDTSPVTKKAGPKQRRLLTPINEEVITERETISKCIVGTGKYQKTDKTLVGDVIMPTKIKPGPKSKKILSLKFLNNPIAEDQRSEFKNMTEDLIGMTATADNIRETTESIESSSFDSDNEPLISFVSIGRPDNARSKALTKVNKKKACSLRNEKYKRKKLTNSIDKTTKEVVASLASVKVTPGVKQKPNAIVKPLLHLVSQPAAALPAHSDNGIDAPQTEEAAEHSYLQWRVENVVTLNTAENLTSDLAVRNVKWECSEECQENEAPPDEHLASERIATSCAFAMVSEHTEGSPELYPRNIIQQQCIIKEMNTDLQMQISIEEFMSSPGPEPVDTGFILETAPNGSNRYRCSIGQCRFESLSCSAFRCHIDTSHGNQTWSGYCSMCKSYPPNTEANQLMLVDALKHFVQNHNSEDLPKNLSLACLLIDAPASQILEPAPNSSTRAASEVTPSPGLKQTPYITVKPLLNHVSQPIAELPSNLINRLDAPQNEEPAEPSFLQLRREHFGSLNMTEINQSPVLEKGKTVRSPSPKDKGNMLIHYSPKMGGANIKPGTLVISKASSSSKVLNDDRSGKLAILPRGSQNSRASPAAKGPVSSEISTQLLHNKKKDSISKIISVIAQSKQPLILQRMLVNSKIVHLYKCGDFYCSYTTSVAYAFTSHLKEHRKKRALSSVGTTGETRCVYCSYENVSIVDLVCHVIEEHGHCTHACVYCWYTATAGSLVELHQKNTHHKGSPMVLKLNPVTNRSHRRSARVMRPRKEAILPYLCKKCDTCNYKFYTSAGFMSHLELHSSDGSFECAYCPGTFIRIMDLMRHLLTHGLGLYQCPYCLHGADTELEMLHHMAEYHPNRRTIAHMRYENVAEDINSARYKTSQLVDLDKVEVDVLEYAEHVSEEDPIYEVGNSIILQTVFQPEAGAESSTERATRPESSQNKDTAKDVPAESPEIVQSSKIAIVSVSSEVKGIAEKNESNAVLIVEDNNMKKKVEEEKDEAALLENEKPGKDDVIIYLDSDDDDVVISNLPTQDTRKSTDTSALSTNEAPTMGIASERGEDSMNENDAVVTLTDDEDSTLASTTAAASEVAFQCAGCCVAVQRARSLEQRVETCCMNHKSSMYCELCRASATDRDDSVAHAIRKENAEVVTLLDDEDAPNSCWRQKKRPHVYTGDGSSVSVNPLRLQRKKMRVDEKNLSDVMDNKSRVVNGAVGITLGSSHDHRIEENALHLSITNTEEGTKGFNDPKRFGEYGAPKGASFLCPLCSSHTTSDMQDMKTHLYEELNYRKLCCPVCCYKAFDMTRYQRHSKIEHTQYHTPNELPPDTAIEEWVDSVITHQSGIIKKSKETNLKVSITDLKNQYGAFGAPQGQTYACPKCKYRTRVAKDMEDGQVWHGFRIKEKPNLYTFNYSWSCTMCRATHQTCLEAQRHNLEQHKYRGSVLRR